MKMPNFLIIGAPRAGTTSLYHYLKRHPQIYMSPVKEPNFFGFGNKHLSSDVLQSMSELKPRYSITDIEAYSALFQGVSNEKAIGEASTWYIYARKAPERIHYYIPDVKLIAILRDPVERAYSAYMMNVREGRERFGDFLKTMQDQRKHICQNFELDYLSPGFYYAHLKRYFDRFDKSQIKIYFYDDVENNALDLLRDIFRFLDVDDAFIPHISIRYNVSGTPKNKILNFLIRHAASFQRKLEYKQLVPDRIKIQPIVEYFVNLRGRNLVKPEVPQDVRRELISIYQEDILKLQDLIQRDLSKWLE